MAGTSQKRSINFCIISRSFLLIMRNVSDKICRENQNTHFVFNNFFFPRIVSFMKYVEKYNRPGESTDDNMAHAHCMLHT